MESVPEKIPAHVAIIMDGNGRWAEQRKLGRIEGHRSGIKTAREIVNYSSEIGIKYLTLYTFSRENWNRPAVEVNMLMRFLEKYLKREAENLFNRNIRFKAIGNLEDLPSGVLKVIDSVTEKTSKCEGMTLQLALSYSGRDEILDAARSLARKVSEGSLDPNNIDEDLFSKALYTAEIPDPDLLIRTSGESRISNFLLWQLAYTELYITDVLWPDFSKDELLKAIRDFTSRERRYGLTREQVVGLVG
ncbi:MAG: isoprenyl transferase [Deltaproteobacteria bacterium]|nr:isoprenyl transferase [Deltaproteobacteria bacterium]